MLKTADPEMYAKVVSQKIGFVSILFFGLENKEVVATGFEIKVRISKNGSARTIPTWRSCPGVDCPKGRYIFLLGEHDAIDRHFGAQRSISPVLADAVAFLIGLEAIDKPNDVQLPIDVLSLDSTGPKWIFHKAECPAIHK